MIEHSIEKPMEHIYSGIKEYRGKKRWIEFSDQAIRGGNEMKDLNICCDESECNNCAFNGLDTFCTLARALPNAPFSIFIERVRSELNELDKEEEYSEVEGLEWV